MRNLTESDLMSAILSIMLLLSSALILVSCGTDQGNRSSTPPASEFVDDNYTIFRLGGQREMCEEKPDSIFCKTTETIGDIQRTRAYARTVAIKLAENHTYKQSYDWYYNDTVYQELEGDCEDVAMTICKHMVDNGADIKHLYLAYKLTDGGASAHIFLAVDTVNNGIIHIDGPQSGYAIERINWYMPLSNAGVNKWIKGNIK